MRPLALLVFLLSTAPCVAGTTRVASGVIQVGLVVSGPSASAAAPAAPTPQAQFITFLTPGRTIWTRTIYY